MVQETTAQATKAFIEKFGRGNVLAKECPSRGVLQNVTSRWGVLILVALLGGSHRFSELRKKITGVSEKMLAQTLQALEADGFVLRISYPVIPPHVEYKLTENGTAVAHKVADLVDWIELNIADILIAQQKFAREKENRE